MRVTMSPDLAERSASSQSDRAVLLLREKLLRGAFKPGERLTELGLAPQLEVSRTPVRHALTRLAHEGLLEELPRGGFRVRAFTVDEIWNAIELRGILEGAAARLAAERLTDPSTLMPAKALLAAMDRALPRNLADFAAYVQMNDEFHRAIWTLAGNSMLLRNIEHVVQLPFAAPGALVFGEAEVPEAQRTADLAQAQHQAIVDAIERGQGSRAEGVAREHALIAWKNIQRALDNKDLFGRLPGASLVKVPFAV
jgi:GntR family transcriptional regulator of vanillate catabolism